MSRNKERRDNAISPVMIEEQKETLLLYPHPQGTIMEVKVHAGAKRDRVVGLYGGRLKIEITTAPERGKANRALLAFLANVLGVAPRNLSLVSGEAKPIKSILLVGVDPPTTKRRIDEVLRSPDQG